MRVVYNLLLSLLTPFALLRLWVKSRKNPDYRRNIAERFAYRLPALESHPMVIHAVSVGEFIALKPLLSALLTELPDEHIHLTCTTPTGRAQIQAFIAQSEHQSRLSYTYFPYDMPCVVKRFFNRLRPKMLIFMETEIWPNMLLSAQKLSIPTLLINARLSKKSLRGYYRFKSALKPALQTLKVNAQTRADARRFRTLGVQDIYITPTLKFIQSAARPAVLADFLPPKTERTILWLAASTHAPEEDILLKAHKDVLKKDDRFRLCLAPRHPERRDELIRLIEQHGFTARLRSRHESLRNAQEIALLDTLGELNHAYPYATLAFIGGTLIPHGGQNPLPAVHNQCCLLFGDSFYNFADIAHRLKAQDFCREVRAQDLAEQLYDLYQWRNTHPTTPITLDDTDGETILARNIAFIRQALVQMV